MFEIKERYDIDDLRELMKVLRSENGCPWDKVQTHESIRMDVLEEAYEVAEAIDSGSKDLLKEELGDLLLQVVFHCEIEDEQKSFNFDDICDGVCKKLVYRHPHVFGDIKADTPEQVLKNWDVLKSESKNEERASDRLKSVPKLLPALMRAEKVAKYLKKLPEDYNLPNIMLTTFYAYYHEKYNFMEITFKPRQGGVNSINIRKIVKIGWKALGDFRKFKKGMK